MNGSMGTLTLEAPEDVNALVLRDAWARHVGSWAEAMIREKQQLVTDELVEIEI